MTGKWIEVFRAGRQTDSNGNSKEWTEQDLDTIVAQYNGGSHEAPIVVGHPEHNSPAFGWVESLKREGKLLYAKFKEVMPEFADLVQAGTYKKRSISLYPNLTLRHIGFLGGMPPAVKGLENIAFADGDQQPMVIEYCDWKMVGVGRLLSNLRDHLIETLGLQKADAILPSYAVQDLQEPPPPEPDAVINRSYNEPEEEGMKPEEVQEMLNKAVTTLKQEFTETVKGLQATISELNKGIVAGREENQRREFREFLMTPEMQRRVSEGSREATINQMMALSTAEPVSFGEGDAKVTKPAVEVYKEQLKALPEVVQFGEFATGDRAAAGKTTTTSQDYGEGAVDQDRLKLHEKVVAYQEAHAGVTYAAALVEVKKGEK